MPPDPLPEPTMEETFSELNPPYSTIVADPPWPYADAGRSTSTLVRTVKNNGEIARGVSVDYSVLTMDDLRALPVGRIADGDSHLYLWTTNGFMAEAHELAKAWGFHPKTILTWVKTHRDDPHRVSMKTGYYYRGATEHVLFCVHGSLKLQTDEGLPTAYLWPRIGQHSVKPAAFFDLVEKASPGPYVELFARQPRLGWDAWGHGYESQAS